MSSHFHLDDVNGPLNSTVATLEAEPSQPEATSVELSSPDYQLQPVWPSPDENTRQDVIRFWMAEEAISEPSVADTRAPQLLVVARDGTGQIAGVSTAVRAFIPLLGFECFYYRTFIGRVHRTHGLRSTGLFWKILLESFAVLNERFQHGQDSDVLALYAEIENASIMRCLRRAVLRNYGMNAVYVGRTQDGRHMRVWYFEGARIP